MTAKWAVGRIATDHWRTLVDARTHKTRVLDVVTFYGWPLVIGVVSYVLGFKLRGLEGVLSGVSIYTALLFGLLVHVFQVRIRIVDKPPASRDVARLIDELEANVSYTVLMGIVTTATLIATVAFTEKDKPAAAWISAVAAALLTHLVLSLLLVLKRTRSAYRNLARTAPI